MTSQTRTQAEAARHSVTAVQPWRLAVEPHVFAGKEEFVMAGDDAEVDRLLEELESDLAVKRSADERIARRQRREEQAALRSLTTLRVRFSDMGAAGVDAVLGGGEAA